MEKVYFDKEFYGSWVVKNLSDMYAFNYIDIRTNEEKSAILVWKRSPVHEEGVGDNERLCAVEFEGEEFFFIENMILSIVNSLFMQRILGNLSVCVKKKT